MMDERLINKIKGVKVDWDKEALWEELEPQLPRPQRGFPWRSIVAGIFLLTVVYCGRENISTLYLPQETLLSSNEEVSEQGHSAILAQENSIQSDLITTNKNNSVKNEEQITTALVQSEEGSPSTTVLRKEYSKSLSLSVEAVEHSFNTHQNSETNTAVDLNIVATMVPSPSSGFSQNNLEEKASDKVETQLPTSETQVMSSTAIQYKQNQRQASKTTNELPILQSTNVFSLYNEPLILSQRPSPTQSTSRQQAGFYADLSVGIGTLNRSIKANTTDPVENTILLDNKAFEQTQFNTLADLGIGYQMKSGLFLQSGLVYSEKHEQLNWKETLFIDTTEFFNERAYFSLDEFGDTTFYSGRSQRIETTERELRHWNKLKTYELPLTIGYSKCYNKLDFRTSIGLLLNLSRQYEGRVIDMNNQVVDNPKIGLSNNFGIGYAIALGAGYQILGKHQLFINGSYCRSPTFHILSVEQSYQSLNIQLGLRTFLGN